MTDKPKPRRRFFRFGLQTVLVTAVLCLLLGIMAKRAREEQRAVETIRELGGLVYYEHQVYLAAGDRFRMTVRAPGLADLQAPGPEWLRRLIGDGYFFTVAQVQIPGPEIDPEILVAIASLCRDL